jgi:hypothetical protein
MVVVPIALRDLFLLVLRLARGLLPLYVRLVVLEDRLLRERRLRRHNVGTLQLEKQGVKESVIIKDIREDQQSIQNTKLVGKIIGRRSHLQVFQSPRWGALEEAALAAIQRSTS